MAQDTPSNPVRTSPVDTALQAARARIAATPSGPTLIDRIDSDLWQAGETGPIEAGAVSSPRDPD